jgi:hypothetical protein
MAYLSRQLAFLAIAMLLLTGVHWLSAQSNSSYQKFKSSYKPHQEKLDPTNKAVQVVQYLSGAELAAVLESYIQEGDKKMFSLLMCSVSRPLAAEAMQAMTTGALAKGLNWLDKYWTLELMWYTDEATFNRVAPSLKAFR